MSDLERLNQTAEGFFILYVWERFRRQLVEARANYAYTGDLDSFKRELNRAVETLRETMTTSGIRVTNRSQRDGGPPRVREVL